MSKHLKRIAAPKTYNTFRKSNVWIVKVAPGPHSKRTSIPLMFIIRDMLHLTRDALETKRLINHGMVLVDGIVRKDYKFPIGLMDIVSIPKLKKNYRVFIDHKGRITLLEVDDKEAKLKLCTVNNKVNYKGKMQLNLHDGTNILLSKTEAKKYHTEGSVLLSLPERKLLKFLTSKEGAPVFITGGNHIGEIAVISGFHKFEGLQKDLVVLKNNKGIVFETKIDYAFVIGEKKPEVKCVE